MTDVRERLEAALTGRYRVARELGAGGMATVYLAHDRKHDRPVALKVLRPELGAVLGGERFLAEIKVTAKLQHPHILPLLDSGEAAGLLYYVMPYVTGETLRARLGRETQLGVEESLRIAKALAGALDYAHGQGVIHRDLKPENILFQANEPVLADFGIALAVTSAGGERLTQTGLSLGTPHYMSPEQAAGDREVDARSDVYALGAVTYEMLAGEPPHTGPTTAVVLMKVLTQAPVPLGVVRPGVPGHVEAAVARALAKAPADRFASAGAFAEALFEPAAAVRAPSKSIVVLPFVSLSPDPSDEFLADGLTTEVIMELSQLRQLKVIARSSSMRLKGTQKDAIRVTVQPVEAETERSLLSERVSGAFADTQDILEQLARRIVASMEVSLSGPDSARLKARRVRNAEAFELALRARKLCNSFDLPQIEAALQCTRRALQLEANNSHLMALLAYAMFTRYNSWTEDEWAMREALQLADRALALDAEEPLACLTKGTLLAIRPGTLADRVDAALWLRRSAMLEPSGEAGAWLAFLYGGLGRADAGAALADRALVIDPLDSSLHCAGSWAHLMRGDLRRSLDLILRAVSIEPAAAYLRWQAAFVSAAGGDTARARTILGTETDASGIIGTLIPVLRLALEGDATGATALAERARSALDWGWSYLAAQLAMSGAVDSALDFLEMAVDQGWSQADMPAKHDGLMASLRGEPRFEALLERMRRQAASIEVPSVRELFPYAETAA